jgi:UDP-glucose 4-epimerase
MALRGQPIEVRGPLDRVRDFVYVEDCVDAWLHAIASTDAVGAFNVGTGVATSIRGLLSLMLELLGTDDHPVHEVDTHTRGDQFALSACTDKAREILGWEARTELRTGLEAMISWARGAIS